MEFTDHPLEPFGRTLLDLSVDTKLGYKTPLVFRTVKLLQSHGCLPAYGCHMAELCLEEALANAMVHGNQLDESRQVRLVVFADEERFGFMFEDEGSGFGPEDLVDNNDPESLLRERGRGIMLIEHYMDQVQYRATGRRLRMVRRRQSEPDPGSVPPAPITEVQAPPPDGTIAPVEIVPVDVEQPAPVAVPDAIELELPAEAAPATGPVLVTEEGKVVIAALAETRVAEENAAAIGQSLEDAADRCDRLVIDLAAVEFMSSVGISTLMMAYKTMNRKRGQLILCGIQPALDSVLRVTGLMKIFETESDRASAVSKMLA